MRKLINKKIDFVSLIRDLLAILFVLWSINPMADFYSRYILGVLLFLWLSLALISDSFNFVRTIQNKGFIISWLFPLFLAVRNLITQNEVGSTVFLITFIYFIFWYYYNQKNINAMKKIFTIGTLYYLLIAMYSINSLSHENNLARFLAQGDQNITIEFAHPLQANFSYIYSATLLVIALIGVLSLSGKINMKFSRRIFILLSIVILYIVIIMAQYNIAIMLTVICTFVVINITRNRSFSNSILDLIILAIVILLLINIQSILYWLSTLTSSQLLKTRLIDLGNVFGGSGIGSTKALAPRVRLYLNSIEVFISNPIIGIGKTSYRMGGLIGGHSEIFDNLGYYGILGSGLWFASLFVNYRYITSKFQKNIKKVYTLVFALYIVHGLLNLSYYIPFLVVLYIIIPFGLYVYTERNYTS